MILFWLIPLLVFQHSLDIVLLMLKKVDEMKNPKQTDAQFAFTCLQKKAVFHSEMDHQSFFSPIHLEKWGQSGQMPSFLKERPE